MRVDVVNTIRWNVAVPKCLPNGASESIPCKIALSEIESFARRTKPNHLCIDWSPSIESSGYIFDDHRASTLSKNESVSRQIIRTRRSGRVICGFRQDTEGRPSRINHRSKRSFSAPGYYGIDSSGLNLLVTPVDNVKSRRTSGCQGHCRALDTEFNRDMSDRGVCGVLERGQRTEVRKAR